jgi:hypothetical protein
LPSRRRLPLAASHLRKRIPQFASAPVIHRLGSPRVLATSATLGGLGLGGGKQPMRQGPPLAIQLAVIGPSQEGIKVFAAVR